MKRVTGNLTNYYNMVGLQKRVDTHESHLLAMLGQNKDVRENPAIARGVIKEMINREPNPMNWGPKQRTRFSKLFSGSQQEHWAQACVDMCDDVTVTQIVSVLAMNGKLDIGVAMLNACGIQVRNN